MKGHAQTLEGLVGKREADELRKLHQNAQRLLQPMLVANPYAPNLTFLDSRTRRDHMKYLTLIRTIALLHQYQRPHKTHPMSDGSTVEYLEVEPSDIALANELARPRICSLRLPTHSALPSINSSPARGSPSARQRRNQRRIRQLRQVEKLPARARQSVIEHIEGLVAKYGNRD